MRIISGKYKGRRLNIPKSFKARPTTDFAKENLFNILNNSINWEETKALDLFGGTGGISFELISRGCQDVVCVEKYAPHYTFIEKTKELLQANNLKIIKTDVFKYLGLCKSKFDFIFADPPYDMPMLESIPNIILEKGLLNEGGTFIMEHSKDFNFDHLPLYKDKRIYGSVNLSIFGNFDI